MESSRSVYPVGSVIEIQRRRLTFEFWITDDDLDILPESQKLELNNALIYILAAREAHQIHYEPFGAHFAIIVTHKDIVWLQEPQRSMVMETIKNIIISRDAMTERPLLSKECLP